MKNIFCNTEHTTAWSTDEEQNPLSLTGSSESLTASSPAVSLTQRLSLFSEMKRKDASFAEPLPTPSQKISTFYGLWKPPRLPLSRWRSLTCAFVHVFGPAMAAAEELTQIADVPALSGRRGSDRTRTTGVHSSGQAGSCSWDIEGRFVAHSDIDSSNVLLPLQRIYKYIFKSPFTSAFSSSSSSSTTTYLIVSAQTS